VTALRIQLHRNAPKVDNYVHQILVDDLPVWTALGWEECSRERTEVLSLGKLVTLVEIFVPAGQCPPLPERSK
jgi:hypothetical protein